MAERNLDFDSFTDRRHTDCLKYDFAKKRGLPEDLLPLWVADMDFRTSSYVEDALAERVKEGIFGYSDHGEAYFRAVAGWMKRRHGWEVREEWMVKTPGVVFALAMAVKAYSREGDSILIQQPVYYPFSEVIRDNGRKVVSSDLVLGQDGVYRIDFQDFERKIEDHAIKLFLLCSPHNPVGRVWTREELDRIGEICLRHGVIVVCDEIHHDFDFAGRHQVFANLSPDFAQMTVTCTAPSKTFNLASLLVSNLFIPNAELRRKFRTEMNAAGMSQLSCFGLVACQAAYEHGDEWYEGMMAYVKANIDYLCSYAEDRYRTIKVIRPQGTYLVWMDFRGCGLSPEELDHKIIYEAGLWLDSGKIFGPAGRGFQRINTACQRATLKEALDRIGRVFGQK